MAFIAAAIIGGSVIGAGATYLSSENAANAQTQAAQTATNAQLSMFGQTQTNLQPFIQAGQGGIPNLQNYIDPNNPNSNFGQYQAWNNPNNPNSPLSSLLKLTTPGPDQSATLEQTPGYQFQLTQGLKAVNNALAARGLGGSGGPVAKGAASYTTGLANSNWQSIVNGLLSTYGAGNTGMGGVFNSGTSALQNYVNTGANAAAGLGNQATQTGAQIGSNIIGAGNAQAGASIATGNAVSGVGSSLGTAALLQQLTGGSTGIYGNVGNMPATGTGSPTTAQSNSYALSQGINPF